ncbi:MAG: glutamate--tRNA ligase [Coriobacteriales bacterium]|jgi:glutamyl-tRNA synthetase|nr:glutamate--tRNA ligase [Coriobacteriales bacterium]
MMTGDCIQAPTDGAADGAGGAAQRERPVRVRFAPSPTGALHIGGARTAIYNWAFARRWGGSFILRIEDTDPERSTVKNTEQIIRSLRWLGLSWDEGPEVGGEKGPYLQTERLVHYREALERLKAHDAVYPCFCAPEELAAKRERALAAHTYSGYDRRCRAIDPGEAAGRIAAGEPHTWRLKVPLDHGPVSWDDEVFGAMSVPADQLDDFILFRSDASPTYNFVVVVDDVLMQISHVIRGDDHLSNTPKQILVYEALEAPLPRFAHLSMILGGDGKRLSKRHGATSVEAYRDEGYLPHALLNYLALLGWSLDGETTLIDAATLQENFSLARVSKNPAIFDPAKLDWINSAALKELGAAAFVDWLVPWLQDWGFTREGSLAWAWEEGADLRLGSAQRTLRFGQAASAEEVLEDVIANRAWYEGIYPLVAERVKTLAEVCPMVAYLFCGESVVRDERSVEKCLRFEGVDDVLARVLEALSDETLTWEEAALEGALRAVVEDLGYKPKVVFQAVRVAVCGNMVSPPLFGSLALLGREKTLIRLENAR